MRILIIERCDQCCYFNNEYYGYKEECIKLHRKIYSDVDNGYVIPEDCPLEELK